MSLAGWTGTVLRKRVILLFPLLVALLCVLVAQSSMPSVRIRLLDSETGFVVPAANAKVELASPKVMGEGAGELEFVLTRETEIHINVPGYRPFAARLEPLSDARRLDVALQPLSLPVQFARTTERLLERYETSVMGFVSDESSGEALSSVEVTSEIGGSVKADESGFFSVSIKLKSSDPILTTITFSKLGYNKLVRINVKLFPADMKKYRIRLRKGTQTEVVDESIFREPVQMLPIEQSFKVFQHNRSAQPLSLPANIRVGLDCKNGPKSCSRVTINACEDHVKHVLPNEWYPSWHTESLKAGSIAVRSYGSWHTEHPLTSTYDFCSTIACQSYDPDSTNRSTDAAIDATAGKVLVDSTGNIARSEYAAENNNAGCGDGKTGAGGSQSPCLDDNLCKGAANNGHGRGMCQWGSQRWATAKDQSGNLVGVPKTYDWILLPYYPPLTTQQGAVSFLLTL